jgi:transcriptional regulator with XRE-family HTH domain
MTIGKIIRKLRTDNNITMVELAEAVFVSQPTITKYENDVRKPSVETIKRIADYFGVTVDSILSNAVGETNVQ